MKKYLKIMTIMTGGLAITSPMIYSASHSQNSNIKKGVNSHTKNSSLSKFIADATTSFSSFIKTASSENWGTTRKIETSFAKKFNHTFLAFSIKIHETSMLRKKMEIYDGMDGGDTSHFTPAARKLLRANAILHFKKNMFSIEQVNYLGLMAAYIGNNYKITDSTVLNNFADFEVLAIGNNSALDVGFIQRPTYIDTATMAQGISSDYRFMTNLLSMNPFSTETTYLRVNYGELKLANIPTTAPWIDHYGINLEWFINHSNYNYALSYESITSKYDIHGKESKFDGYSYWNYVL